MLTRSGPKYLSTGAEVTYRKTYRNHLIGVIASESCATTYHLPLLYELVCGQVRKFGNMLTKIMVQEPFSVFGSRKTLMTEGMASLRDQSQAEKQF